MKSEITALNYIRTTKSMSSTATGGPNWRIPICISLLSGSSGKCPIRPRNSSITIFSFPNQRSIYIDFDESLMSYAASLVSAKNLMKDIGWMGTHKCVASNCSNWFGYESRASFGFDTSFVGPFLTQLSGKKYVDNMFSVSDCRSPRHVRMRATLV